MLKTYNKQKNVLGKFITEIRKSKRITREELSKLLELQGVYINKDELYRMENMQLLIKDFELIAIFDALDIDISLKHLKKYLDN